MSPAATVIIPTHDHGATLRCSVESALRQDMHDIEIFIVGDGVPDAARPIIAELTAKDPRIRFFDFPKGERHGEASRHLALQEARGEIVCYLGDDDLWFPEHVGRMHEALQHHNFVSVLVMRVDADGSLGSLYGDLSHPLCRERLGGRWNFMPLSSVAHRMDLYRMLPRGWHPAPPDAFTDLYMWHQFLSHEAVDPVTLFEPTVVNFPSPPRRSWTLPERVRELEVWMPRITETDRRAELRAAFLRVALRDRAHVDASTAVEAAALRASGEREAAERETLAREIQRAADERDRLGLQLREAHEQFAEREAALGGQLSDTRKRLEASEAALEQMQAELAVLLNSVTWRARTRLVALPLVRQPLTWVARALAARRSHDA